MPESEYFKVICRSLTDLPVGASQLEHPMVRSKVSHIVQLVKPDLRKIAAKGAFAKLSMISDECPFGVMEPQAATINTATASLQTSTTETGTQQDAMSKDQPVSPSDKEVIAAIHTLILSMPESGWRKLLPDFKALHANWSVSEKRFKALLREARNTKDA
eukprot:UN1472